MIGNIITSFCKAVFVVTAFSLMCLGVVIVFYTWHYVDYYYGDVLAWVSVPFVSLVCIFFWLLILESLFKLLDWVQWRYS